MPENNSERFENRVVRSERYQFSHGRLIHVVSVFPAEGTCTPEDKLRKLIDMDLRKEKQCA